MTQQSMTLQQASTDYQKAVAVYNSKINPTDSQLKQAQSTLDQALAQLAKLTDPSPKDLQAAQANVDQTRRRPRYGHGAARQCNPPHAVRRHRHARRPRLGSFAAAGRTILGVADTTEQLVKVNIDETDIARVKTGQDVTIGLDAYPDVTLTGKVTDVAAATTTTQGVVNYVVTVTLKPGDVPIKMGMTANAEHRRGAKGQRAPRPQQRHSGGQLPATGDGAGQGGQVQRGGNQARRRERSRNRGRRRTERGADGIDLDDAAEFGGEPVRRVKQIGPGYSGADTAMNPLESIHVALGSLGANKLRSALTMLGIIIGVGAVIALLSIGQGAGAAITAQVQGIGSNLIFVIPGQVTNSGIRSATGTASTLTLADADALGGRGCCANIAAAGADL